MLRHCHDPISHQRPNHKMNSDKILIVYSFLACFFLMIVGIFSARTTNQLLNAFIYLPLVFFFGTKIFHPLIRPLPKPALKKSRKGTEAESSTDDSSWDPATAQGVADNNKRLFLQLIGTTGISLLIMSLFSRRARDTFFSGSPVTPEVVSLKDIAGNPVNPAEKQATDGYSISDIDDGSFPAYYSFVNNNGAWYIMQNISGTFRYAKGDSNYSASWDIRNKLHYDYYNKIFG